MGDDDQRCQWCKGRGFVLLKAIETHATHSNPSKPLVRKIVTFRAPCLCAAGTRWLEARRSAPTS